MLQGLRLWRARRRYEREAWKRIGALFVPMNSVVRLIRTAYPGARTEILKAWEEHEAVEEVAARISSAVLARVMEDQMDDPTRDRALQEIHAFAANDPPTSPLPIVETIVTATGIVRIWAETGRLDEQSRKIFMDEVMGALHGRTHKERRAGRLIDALRETAGLQASGSQLRQEWETGQEEALDQAVAAIRRAEQEGRVAVDPRSDEVLRESVRTMWESEPRDEP
jgi:hypothetical protein